MANFNTLIKRKQYLWLVLILVGGACAIAGGMYLSDLNLSSEEEAPVQGEPAPDMTGVVDSQFNSKVEQHATTEMQATAADLNKRFGALQGEVDLLSKARSADQIRIDKLSNENVAMQEQLKTLGVKQPCLAASLRLRHPRRRRDRKGSRSRQISPRSLVVQSLRQQRSILAMAPCRLHRLAIRPYRYRTRYSAKRSAMTAVRKRSHCPTFRQAALPKAS